MPPFPGFYQYSKLVAGSSMLAAELINENLNDTVISWIGGHHHARKSQGSGFCYLNDCVLGIMKLLHKYRRVLYIDIDIHHGDGVQQAFYNTNRVCTLSFHQYEPYDCFYPGTGNFTEVGINQGEFCSVNVPFKRGLSDNTFINIFKLVVDRTIEVYQPEAVFMQCGADSLKGDLIGEFNLSIATHCMCLQYVKSKGLPTIYTGGGGYNIENVVKCWTTSSLYLSGQVDSKLSIPPNSMYKNYFSNDNLLECSLDINKYQKDTNSSNYCSYLLEKVLTNIHKINNSIPFLDRIVRDKSENYYDLSCE